MNIRTNPKKLRGFERYVTVVPDIVRQIDRRHAPAPELALDSVAVCQSSLEEIGGAASQSEGPSEEYPRLARRSRAHQRWLSKAPTIF